MNSWEQIYDVFGIRDFIYFISSSSIQNTLFPIKVVFVFFTAFFLCAVIYFYMNSSYLRCQFLQDSAEFLSWQPYGLVEITRRLKKIMKRTESGFEHDHKLAIIEADDLLYQTLQDRDYEGETFEELVSSAGKKMVPNFTDIMEAHAVRNSIVYEPDYSLESEQAKKVLADYERAIKTLTVS